MDRYSRYGVIFGRILISAVFIVNGLGIVDQRMAAKELAEAGVSSALVSVLMLVARSLETVAGFALAFGIGPKWAAFGLLLFLVPATWIGHPFWRLAGTPEFQGQLVNFFKNVAIMGGLLFIMGAPNSKERINGVNLHYIVAGEGPVVLGARAISASAEGGVIPECGHWVFEEKTDFICRQLETFWQHKGGGRNDQDQPDRDYAGVASRNR